MRRFNQKTIILEPVPPRQSVAVLQPDGDYITETWGGFINADDARRLVAAKSVRLEIAAWQLGDGSEEWIQVPKGQHILGCQTGELVRAVLYGGKPRVV